MNRLKNLLIAALILSFLSVGPVFADEEKSGAGVDFGIEGYYRVRYDNMFKTEWAFDDESDWWNYFNQRMLVEPTLTINEQIKLVMQLDILRNVTFGSNQTVHVPVVQVDRNSTDLEQIDQVEFDTFDINRGNVLSQEMSNTDEILGTEVDPISIRRLYGEVKLPFGLLRVGRQPSNFGLGIFSNAGDGTDDDFGDYYDRLLFGTKIGPYMPVFIYDKVVEDDYKVADTDVHQLIWVNYIRDITWGKDNHFDAGLYMLMRSQQSTDARIFIYDLWARLQFGGFRIETEAAAIQGKFTMFDHDTIEDLEENGLPTGEGGGKITADAYINANQFAYSTEKWGVDAEFGFSSPADPNPEREFDATGAGLIAVASGKNDADEDSAQTSIDFINVVVENQAAFGTHAYTFPMDKDYSVDLIIWETLMGGAVKNGIYAKLGGHVNPLDFFHIELDLVKSWINESGKGENGADASHDLGWEIDSDFAFSVADHFTFGIQFGYAFPGQYFRDVYEGVENVFTMQTRFLFEF